MSVLHRVLSEKIPVWTDSIRKLVKEHGDEVTSTVTVEQAYGGMRGVKALVCDTSLVPPETGLILRGIPIAQLKEKLPEEIFYLLMTGELPDQGTLKEFQEDLERRSAIPNYVWDVLKSMPPPPHPSPGSPVRSLRVQEGRSLIPTRESSIS